MEQGEQGGGGKEPAAQRGPQRPGGGPHQAGTDQGSRPAAAAGDTGPSQAAPAAADPTGARDGKPRRQRSRRPKKNAGAQAAGADASSSAAAAAASSGGAAPGLTWQQQEMMLSAAAPAFVPGDQQQQEAGRGRPPREAGRGRGGRQGRSRGRGRGRGGGYGGPPPFEPPTWQQEQWQLEGYAAGPDGSNDGPGGRQPDVQADSSEHPAQHPAEQQQQQQQRPPAGQRRRERPPRDPAYLQQQRGAGGRQQQLEAAASVAANRRQQQRQAASAAEEDSGQQSSASDDAPAAAGAAQNGAGEEAAAGRAARRPEMARYDPQQRERRQRRDAPGRAPSGSSEAQGVGADAGSSGPAAAAAAAGAAQPAEAAPEAPHCLVCTSPMAEVAIGACNHKEVCGQCMLRMRLCYGRRDCPLCKAELKEVIIAPWRPQLPEWEFYLAQPEYVARSTKWARGEIWADRWRRGGRLSSRLLHDLQRRTALACCVCDPGGESPFMRREQLLRHVQEAHDQRLCSLCLQEGRLFPLELEPFPSFEALQAHSSAAHPHCAFCRRTFYDDDALWKHMHQVHYFCHVCPPPMGAHAYFNRAPDLVDHLRQDHFLCEEPECADCFVAFASADELRRHHLERHSARMPRWDPSRARTLQLDISYTRRGGPAAAAEGRPPRRRPQGPQDVRVLDGPESAAAAAAAAGEWPSEYAHETDGGLRIIDDAEFPSAAAAYAGGGHGGPSGSLSAGGWGGRQRAAPRQRGGDDFPSLAATAGGPEGGGGSREAAPRPPPLVKKSAKCPCGRRVSHYAVQEGEEVPPLECDAVCRLEGRKAQLADAFGVGDPAHHLSYWDTHRNATYSGVLLAAAQAQPKFIEGLERQLAAFVADKDSKRQSLSAMPREQRQVVHQLAEQYGLATTAYGQEPGRYIELFKTPSAGIPSRLLSRVAPTVPAEEVAALLRESEGHPMRLTDIALSADVRFYLRRWEGAYSLEWQGGDTAVVRFEREQDLKDALDTLGGGIRGLFRVDRSWRPKTAVATVAPSSSGGGAARGWGGSEASGSRDGADGGGTWTAVAVAPATTRHDTAQQQPAAQPAAQQSAASGDAGPRWAVMAPRRTARPALAPAPMSLSGSRNLLSELTPELEDVHTSDSDG